VAPKLGVFTAHQNTILFEGILGERKAYMKKIIA
jgi:hypothetical protein